MNLTSNKGLNLENGRSSLVWEVIRILKNTIHKPAFLLMENVSAITNKQNINDFNSLIEKLSLIGYNSFYIKLNGLESGSIQHRPRVFMLSIRNDLNVPFSNNEEFNNYVLEIAKKYQNTPQEQEQKYKNAIFTSTEHFRWAVEINN
ncbi:DNA cytosine methyltransferase [Mycoplasmopsis felis]|uniref:DNA cytosine methyltransferase n=1 Tax=Mycoplasmopsis felis TaxID=33923 RepID=UPI0021AFC3AC|nr:DNA cytosine methyltransferase [Mycoplasmopsis felis]UWV79332.1 DNA cytosine methyltransferase [Mycoplasmopsis felis]